MSYTTIPSALLDHLDAAVQTIFLLIKSNFSDHQTRINAIESTRVPLPVGTIIEYGGAAPPTGFLDCDGSAVNRVTYADLFAAIGTDYGVGDGSTTFNLPDLRGRAAVGAGAGSGLTNRVINGTKFGTETHTLVEAELAQHNHGGGSVASHSHNFPNMDSGGGSGSNSGWHAGLNNVTNDVALTSINTGVTLANTGGGGAHNNMQPFQVITFAIRT